jgi:predicted nucleotidyltransferase component of viral defense system
MLEASQSQALHKSIMLRVLINILDDPFLSQNLYFKGGTCASMLGYLDRFSVDLDFDIKDKNVIKEVQKILERIFSDTELVIKDKSNNTIQYFLKYEAPVNSRNTLKIDAIEVPHKYNKYEKILLPEINRFAICQNKSTLFTNKLVAIVDRYEKNNSIAGRDIYDIHHFLQQGFDINDELIKERRGVDTDVYLKDLEKFIENNISETTINQDLNFLLEPKKFNAIRKTLKDETLALIKSY